MSIFREFGGRASYYTPNELDRLQNPEKYNYDQAGYDAYSASVQKKHDARQAADSASQDAIPYGYVGRGAGDTNPAFSFAGYSGHTSGGTAGNVNLGGRAGIFGSGSTTETTGSGTGTGGGPGGGPPGGPGGGKMQHKAEGGVIYPVQHMEAGGMIASPYANPMKPQMGNAGPMVQEQVGFSVPSRAELQGSSPMGGVGGMFQNMHQQFGQQMQQMQSSPLKVYSDYLNQTYTGPQSQEMQSKVTEFVDLVDQAERAHFGVEESFGYGKPPLSLRCSSSYMSQMGTMGPGSMSGGKWNSLFTARFLKNHGSPF
jgi:hypothetical protein